MLKNLGALVSRANRDAAEAQDTRESLVAAAEAMLPKWPRRRWRVEQSAAGNSALTTEAKARRLQARCGGKAVEVIESMEARKKRLAKERRAAKAAEKAAALEQASQQEAA